MAINGTQGDDFFRGTRFNDEIFGLGGNDVFNGSRGEDRLDGGQGVDSVSYFDSLVLNIPIPGGAVDVDLERASQIGGLADGDVLVSIENVEGSKEDDVIRGNNVANELLGNGGNDVLEGRGGDDILRGDFGGFVAGDLNGEDILDGGSGNDQLFGEGGNDTLIGGTGVNRIDGGAGIDTASYAGFANGVLVSLVGTSGNGIALGLGSTDVDTLFGIENITGSSFADQLSGSAVAKVINAGGGNDLILGGAGADTLSGGSGVDTASYAGSTASVDVDLGILTVLNINSVPFIIQTAAGSGTGGDAQGDVLNLVENLTGSNFADTLTGNLIANRLDGGRGGDTIDGGAGNDIIVGGSGAGFDILTGGAGADNFQFLSRDDSRVINGSVQDFIADFRVGEDLLDLSALNVSAGNIIILNGPVSTLGVDDNGNGSFDNGEFAISVTIDGGGLLGLGDLIL